MARRDANHAEIVAGLRAAGCSVVELHAVGSGVPDILAARGGLMRLIEIMTAAGLKGRHGNPATTAKQVAFREAWRGPAVVVVSSLAEAFAAVGVAAVIR